MTDDILFIDVNIPMYAAGRHHPHKAACTGVMTAIAEGRIYAAIDTEIVQEVLYRYGNQQRWDIATQMSRALLDLMPIVLPVTPADARLAVELFERYAPRGVKARDVIHVAVMQSHGIRTIVSVDRHFDQIDDIARLDPHDISTEH